MAVVWAKRVGGTDYQVRRAGRTLRLYTNGVFHSQFNPNRPVTGSVWDLLWLPAFFFPPGDLRRVLLLGVGGGTVIRQLQRFTEAQITGVELSVVHLSIARRFFGVRGPRVRLEQADARAWLREYRGPAFDLIIDDLFSDANGEPQRAVHADDRWAGRLLDCLAPTGAIVSNFASRLELDVSAYRLDPATRQRLGAAFALSTPQNHNAVGVFLTWPAGTRRLRQRLQAVPALDPRRRQGVRYQIRTLAD